MEVEELSRAIEGVQEMLAPSLTPLIDMVQSLPKTSEVKSLQRKLRRSYSSLSDAIDSMPNVLRSLEMYQPNISFNAETAQPTAAQLSSIRAALAEENKRNAQRAQMALENTRSNRLRQRERNRRAGNMRAAFSRGEEVIHIDGGRRTRKQRH